jgi:hypothetical protein
MCSSQRNDLGDGQTVTLNGWPKTYLTLAMGEVRSPGFNLTVQCDSGRICIALKPEQSGRTERIIQDRVFVLAEGVQVFAHAARQKIGVLRDERYISPKSIEVDLVYV